MCGGRLIYEYMPKYSCQQFDFIWMEEKNILPANYRSDFHLHVLAC